MNQILVPTDFTPAAERATEYAIALAKLNNSALQLLHVVNKPEEKTLRNRGSSIEAIERQMAQIAENIFSNFNIRAEIATRRGSIFNIINQAAEDFNCELVVMGNHGATNFYQHFFGPYALRIAAQSKISYLLVNENAKDVDFKNIILPVDHTQNQENKLLQAIKFAKATKSSIHLVVQYEKDAALMEQVVKNLRHFSETILKKFVIMHKAFQPENMAFADFILGYSEDLPGNLIVVNVYNDATVKIAYGYSEDRIINNDQNIPVLCVPGQVHR